MTACDTAFRILALRYLGDLTANHEATCKGDPEALHQMRVVLTRLRTAVLFFSPMVVDSQQPRVKGELKWLNTNLGVVRDLDVAMERLKAGVDISRAGIKMATSYDRAITWIVASLHDTPFSGQSLDVVLSMFAPIDIADVSRVLRQDGVLITVTPGPIASRKRIR